jgi:hypothetical protein
MLRYKTDYKSVHHMHQIALLDYRRFVYRFVTTAENDTTTLYTLERGNCDLDSMNPRERRACGCGAVRRLIHRTAFRRYHSRPYCQGRSATLRQIHGHAHTHLKFPLDYNFWL